MPAWLIWMPGQPWHGPRARSCTPLKAPRWSIQPWPRWIHLDEQRANLVEADPSGPYGPKDREEAASKVARICASAKDDYGISTLKRMEGDDEATTAAKDRAYFTAIRMRIENGIWQVPCHAWNGAGAPASSGYDHAADYPVFAYRNDRCEDVSAEAYGVTSPYAFYEGLLPNAIAGPDSMPSPNNEAIDYFSAIFSGWSDRYGFDFVRMDAVDRLLWSSLGTEVDEFAREGFDLLMGSDMMQDRRTPAARILGPV